MKNDSSLTEVAKRKRRKRIKHIVVYSVCGAVAIISALVSFGIFGNNTWTAIYGFFGLSDFTDKPNEYPLCVSFVDVGNGDCILIECEGHAALIDSGVLSLEGTAVKYMEKRNIESLDFIVCTHMDDDHIGDMESIIESVVVKKFYITRISDEKKTESTERLSQALNAKNLNPEVLKCGTNLKLGEMVLEVISPIRIYDEDNDNSIVLRAVYGEISFLFTGDSGEKVEKDILASGKNIKSTVLKVAHHGSKTSTTEEFLNAVSPKLAVVCVGDINRYLPNRETIERINSFGCELLRTDESGTIILASDGQKIYKYKEN